MPIRLQSLLYIGLIVGVGFTCAAMTPWSSRRSPEKPPARLAPDLAAAVQHQPAGREIAVIAFMAAPSSPAADSPAQVKNRLQHEAALAQGSVLAGLRQLEAQGLVRAIRPLWIVNAVGFSADPAAVTIVAGWPGVRQLTLDAIFDLPTQPAAGTTPLAAAAGSAPVTPNLVAVNAPLLWTLGITGTGVVVGSLDTGVDGTHPELAATWRGDAHAWFDPYHQCATPCDLNGHGTQVMGVMVGGAASGTAIGMAPGATWIAARIFNTTGQAQASTIHLAFQWALDPDGNPATDDAPDVVNASWDVINPGGCDLTFAPDLQALVAAGIVPVFAAGNSGPNPASAVSPANNPDALAVGAVDNAGVVASFSSRGPTSCGTGAARTFPELAAPGVAVSTTDRMVVGDPAPRYVPASGTSLAAPHVAGGLALLISAFPGRRFSAAELRVALSFTARPLPDQASTPNNDTGAGLLDLWAAYEALRQDSLPTATPTTAPSPSPTPTAIWSFASRTIYLPFVRRELP